MKAKKVFDKRRVFINTGDNLYQVLSFNQHEDGSIYCSMPEFTGVKWMSFGVSKETGQPMMIIVDSPDEMGKLSMHGSGMLTFRSHKDEKGHSLIIKGNPLINVEGGKIGMRHLFTYFPTEPKHLPNSPAFNRESDYVLKKTGDLKPFVMVFFAVPSKPGLSAKIKASFHVDDVETIPPDFAFGTLGLRYHNVVWFYYRTKYMGKWPQSTHICYFDGHEIPMFIGSELGEARVEVRNPTYIINGNQLSIAM